jgi:hypothetical protein
MKKPVRYLIITLLVLAVACLTMVISPTFGRQVPFNEWTWKHHPVQKVRYYMSDSILEWLNKEKPSREAVMDKLGDGKLDEISPSSNSYQLIYWLMSKGFLGVYALAIDFNADGSFQEATILCID